MADPILVAQNIYKQFPGVRALSGVDLELMPGEVHALVGENGAGKSTLIKVFGGLHSQTSGSIFLDGKEVHFDNPLQSQRAGISVITQEFNLVPNMTIAENIFLGREPKNALGFIDWKTINAKSEDALKELGISHNPTQKVEYLSVADKQLVEIAKALSHDFRVMVMDEPTAALNSAEVERLFEIIDVLRKRNVAILYVSHRLGEIFRMADRVTVLRDGKRVGTEKIENLTENSIITMMLGRELKDRETERIKLEDCQDNAICVESLCLTGALEDVSFNLHYGEVLGCAGLIGSGRSELVRVLFGLIPGWNGKISVNGQEVEIKTPGEALKQGIFMLPEDRKVEGIFPDLSVRENILIHGIVNKFNLLLRVFLSLKSEKKEYSNIKDYLSVKAHSPAQLISTLSGGNQQKAIFGRALVSQSKILLLNEPTRGVDVGTKLEIHELIRKLASEGHAILVSSSDVPELVQVSDRCLVMSAGRITKVLEGENLNEDNILASAVGHFENGDK